jgi:branched-subunit amino acid transport protein
VTWELVAIVALITYASRAAALVFLPPLPPRVRSLLDRMPPALFAGLAAQSLIVPGEGLVAGPTIAGAVGALAVSPRRSLPLCLVAGVAAFVAWSVVSGA